MYLLNTQSHTTRAAICFSVFSLCWLQVNKIQAEERTGTDQGEVLTGADTGSLFFGKQGSDDLRGSAAADTYFFRIGDGVDRIFENVGQPDVVDIISFAEGIIEDDIEVSRQGVDLLIRFSEGDDLALVKYAFGDAALSRSVEEFVFADGSTLQAPTLADYGDSLVYGTEGVDNLSGSSADQLFVGGLGNDTLYGGLGNDSYYYNLGDGNDTIRDEYTAESFVDTNTLFFGEDISPADIALSLSSRNLIITVSSDTGDSTIQILEWNRLLTIEGASRYHRETWSIQFADGTVWDGSFLATSGNDTIAGTGENDTFFGGLGSDRLRGESGDDILHGEQGNDTIYGGEGNDTLRGGEDRDLLYGENGNDTLYGGLGNDTLYGGLGNDSYYYNLGDGNDTIRDEYTVNSFEDTNVLYLGEDISPADIALSLSSRNLIITVSSDTGDSTIQILEWNRLLTVEGVSRYHRETWQMQFPDGGRYYAGNIPSRAVDYILGSEADDVFYGYAGNDILESFGGDDNLFGGAGDDVLRGGLGSDSYAFAVGEGTNVIEEDYQEGDLNTVVFDESLNQEDFAVFSLGADLVLVNEAADLAARIEGWMENNLLLSEVRFGYEDDAEVWGVDDLLSRALDNSDSNGDGIADAIAYQGGISLIDRDFDNDGIENAEERALGLNQHSADTDGDDVPDGEDGDPLDADSIEATTFDPNVPLQIEIQRPLNAVILD